MPPIANTIFEFHYTGNLGNVNTSYCEYRFQISLYILQKNTKRCERDLLDAVFTAGGNLVVMFTLWVPFYATENLRCKPLLM